MDSQRILIITSAALALACAVLGYQLYERTGDVEKGEADLVALSLEKDHVLFDLEKLRFSYDTLNTENALIIAEIADQRAQIDGLVQQVRNGNWSLSRAKKEAETLRTIMKGYVATIDSLNQLNLALIDENDQMRARVEEVQERNANLVIRQQNMEDIISTGQTLQASESSASGIRLLSNGKQRESNRAARADMVRVCFTLLENKIASPGNKTLHLQVTTESGEILLGSQTESTSEDQIPISATRQLDYANERLEACVFFMPIEPLSEGIYAISILEGSVKIGEAQLVLY
jgi:hypothetical protein